MVCPFTPQLSLVLINRPRRDGTLSWRWYTAVESEIQSRLAPYHTATVDLNIAHHHRTLMMKAVVIKIDIWSSLCQRQDYAKWEAMSFGPTAQRRSIGQTHSASIPWYNEKSTTGRLQILSWCNVVDSARTGIEAINERIYDRTNVYDLNYSNRDKTDRCRRQLIWAVELMRWRWEIPLPAADYQAVNTSQHVY